MTVIPTLDKNTSKAVSHELNTVLAELKKKHMVSDKAERFIKQFYSGQDRLPATVPQLLEALKALAAKTTLDPSLVRRKLDSLIEAGDAKLYGGGRLAEKIQAFLADAVDPVKGAGHAALPPRPAGEQS